MTLWKHCLALTLFAALAGTSACALAQDAGQQPGVTASVPASEPAVATTAPAAAPSTAPVTEAAVQWTLEVLRDGQQIDSFDGTTTVSPLQVRANLIVLSIDAQETFESDTAPSTPEGCKLPPQPRQVNANHPGLVVPDGQWVSWQIVDQNPSLAYRVRATLAPQAAQ